MSTSTDVHLVVIHHGLWGTPLNTSFLATTLAKFHGGTLSPSTTSSSLTPPESLDTIATHASTHPNADRKDIRLIVLNSEVNSGDHTYDGIDWCGERLVADIYKEVKRVEEEEEAKVIKFSLIGYSLGGLIIRYAAGVLLSDGFFSSPSSSSSNPKLSSKKGREFKSRPVAASLSTIATPHLGIPATNSTFSKVANFAGARILGRSGRQLYLVDRDWNPPTPASSPSSSDTGKEEPEGMSLIEALSDPRFTFIKALGQFQRIDIYANAIADLTVAYRTAAFEPLDPFSAFPPSSSCEEYVMKLERNADFPPILDSYSIEPSTPVKSTFLGKVKRELSPKNLPWILNPQRFPFRFPLNYVAWVFLPVLLPVMMGLVVHKLRSDSKVSNTRVGVLSRRWAEENGHLPSSTPIDGKQKMDIDLLAGLEKKRISSLLTNIESEAEETLREVGEDFVSTNPASPYQTSQTPSTEGEGKYDPKPNTPTLTPSTLPTIPNPNPLSETQLKIASYLNDKSLLPQVKKHLVHFDDVLNAHAVIIVRTVGMEVHKKGITFIKGFVARFGL